MFDISAFLERARAGAGDVTYYRLAKLIGVTTAAISQYKSGARMPDATVIVRLCDYSGDDPEHVVACVESMRAANDPATAAMWQRMADRLRRRSSLALFGAAVALAAVNGAGVTEAQAALPPHDAAQGLRIMSSLLLSWILYRTVTRRCRFPNARAPLMSIRLSPSRHRA